VPSDFDLSPYQKRFKSIFDELYPGKDYIYYIFWVYIKKLLRRSKIGSSLDYQYAYNSVREFGGNVQLHKNAEDWLFDYENWVIRKKNQPNNRLYRLTVFAMCFQPSASSLLNIISAQHH